MEMIELWGCGSGRFGVCGGWGGWQLTRCVCVVARRRRWVPLRIGPLRVPMGQMLILENPSKASHLRRCDYQLPGGVSFPTIQRFRVAPIMAV
jgi:hypothetical protein